MRTRVPLPIRSALAAATAGLLLFGGASAAYATVTDTGGDGVTCPDGTTPDADTNEDGVIDQGDCPPDPGVTCPDGTTPDTDTNGDGTIDQGDCPPSTTAAPRCAHRSALASIRAPAGTVNRASATRREIPPPPGNPGRATPLSAKPR